MTARAALRAALLAALLAGGCGRTLTVYHRTSPRRVEVDKQASPPRLFVAARHGVVEGGGAVELHVKRASRVKLRRVVHYNAAAMKYEHSRSVFGELSELLFGLLMVTVPPAFLEADQRMDGPSSPTRKIVRHRRFILAMLDPTTSAFTSNVRTEFVVKEQVFSEPAVVREYEVRLPAAGAQVTYRAFDEAGQTVANGSSTTDLHGETVVANLPESAVAVEVAADGQTVVVPILAGRAGGATWGGGGSRGLTRVPSGAPSEGPAPPPLPAPANAAVATPPPAPLSKLDAGRPLQSATPKDATSARLPWVSLTLDFSDLALPLAEVTAEVRVLPRLSVAAMGGFGQYELSDDPATRTLYKGGGQLAFYPLGSFRHGLKLVADAQLWRIDVDDEAAPYAKDIRSLGGLAGYKWVAGPGLTIDVELGYAWITEDVVGGDTPLVAAPDPYGLFDVKLGAGWSF